MPAQRELFKLVFDTNRPRQHVKPAKYPWFASGPRGVTVSHLPGRLQIGLGPGRSGIVGHHGLTVARSFGYPDAARDDRAQDDLAEVLPDLLGHLRRQPRA